MGDILRNNSEECTMDEGSGYLCSSWSRIGRPTSGIFDDV